MVTIRHSNKFGWKRSLPDYRDYKLLHTHATVAARPSSVDLRPHMPPVWDQLSTSSCTGNAAAAAVSYNLIKQGFGNWTPSRLFAYYNARRIEDDTDQDGGAQIRDVIKGLVEWGIPPETEWAFSEANVLIRPPVTAYADALNHTVTSYLAVDQTVDAICTTLAGGEPIVFGFTVYDAFEGDEVAKTGVLNLPTAGESMVGGHAVVAVGYDDSTQRFLVRNSWGTDWSPSMGGYFTMPYAYLTNRDLADDLWIIRSIKS